MCGICGLFLELSKEDREAKVREMTTALRHRGPNSSGVWSAEDFGITLGHTRLSILDTSDAGLQPMISSDGKNIIVFNGEIYNFKSIKNDLIKEGTSFKSGSDTEVLLEALTLYGVAETLKRLNGMFAFGFWCSDKKTLTLCRDRMGIKPLYFGWVRNSFFFSSELKAAKAADLKPVLNRSALADFLTYSYIPAPKTIAKNVYKLPPGTYIELSESQMKEHSTAPDFKKYWSLTSQIKPERLSGSYGDFKELARQSIRRAVEYRMIADVPLGAFLSGGIDSSLVVAMMSQTSSLPVRTFCIGFEKSEYDESSYAKAVAERLNCNHTELFVTAKEAQAVIPELAKVYDEPFADSSQIPTYLVSSLAARDVRVCLSGDGGDELFSGYNRYIWSQRVWKAFSYLPVEVRRLVKRNLSNVPARTWDRYFNLLSGILPGSLNFKLPGDKLAKLFRVIDAETFRGLYHNLISHWEDISTVLMADGESSVSDVTKVLSNFEFLSFSEQMMLMDSHAYLPEDLLTKVDRASMAHSLEVRVPFVDHQLTSQMWQLPDAVRTLQKGGMGKVILRDLLGEFIPEELFERPKMGFAIPIGEWLRGPIKDWAESLLDIQRLDQQGLLDSIVIRNKWEDHLSGRANWQYDLWDILMLQSWLDQGYVEL